MQSVISIIIPVYNGEKYLTKCLNSIKYQTYTDFEVLMIDDGSNDHSAEICISYAKDDSRFHYHYQLNAGASSARNTGLTMASGEFITFIDCDDWIDADYLEILYTNLVNRQADVSVVAFTNEPEHKSMTELTSDVLTLSSDEALCEMNHARYYMGHTCGRMYHKNVISELRFNCSLVLWEDHLFCTQAFKNAEKIIFIPYCGYHYLIHESSLCHSKNVKESDWCSIAAFSLAMQETVTMSEKTRDAQRKFALQSILPVIEKAQAQHVFEKRHYDMIGEDFCQYAVPAVVKDLSLRYRWMCKAARSYYRLKIYFAFQPFLLFGMKIIRAFKSKKNNSNE